MMNMQARLPVLIHHSSFRIHHFLSCSSCPSMLIISSVKGASTNKPVLNIAWPPLVLDDAYVQLVQLVRVNRAGRVNHQIRRRGRLRKRHQVAYVLDACERHQHALDACGDAAVRRRAVLKGVEEEAEALARLLFRQTQSLEDEALH